jgi:hypothetical protein
VLRSAIGFPVAVLFAAIFSTITEYAQKSTE